MNVGSRWDSTTTTDSRSQRNRAGRRGGQLLTRARGSSYKNGLPTRSAPRCPLSRMVTPYARTARRGTVRHRLYHAGYELAGERQCSASQNHQDARTLPFGRCGDQTTVAGAAKHHRRLASCCSRLEGRHAPVRDPLRGSLYTTRRLAVKPSSSMFEQLNCLEHENPDSPLGAEPLKDSSHAFKSRGTARVHHFGQRSYLEMCRPPSPTTGRLHWATVGSMEFAVTPIGTGARPIAVAVRVRVQRRNPASLRRRVSGRSYFAETFSTSPRSQICDAGSTGRQVAASVSNARSVESPPSRSAKACSSALYHQAPGLPCKPVITNSIGCNAPAEGVGRCDG